jgi:two-component system OmpR family response regulator
MRKLPQDPVGMNFLEQHNQTNCMPQSSQNQKKILIVEDEGDLCLLLEIMLKDENTSIDSVKTIQDAREFLEKEKPHLVLLDNRLPDGFGLDFIPYLKEHHPSTRIIMISGKDRSAKDIALENGANIFLSKPFTREQLSNSIRLLLN